MKNFKKFSIGFLALISVLFISNKALAVSTDVAPQLNVPFTVSGCLSSTHEIYVYSNDNNVMLESPCDPGNLAYNMPFLIQTASGLNHDVLAGDSFTIWENTTGQFADPSIGAFASLSFNILAAPPAPAPKGISILGGTAPSAGSPFDGNAMVAGVGGALGKTMSGAGPMLALVIGMFLCLILIARVVFLYKGAGKK